jgi:DNA-directed RNA polymerase specialized sigma24 family protein
MTELRTPEQLTITELIQEAYRETQAYLRKQSTVDTCTFELFRRAILSQDEQAWSGIYGLYNAVVCSWILCRLPTVQREDLDALVNEAFVKFSRSIGPARLKGFSSVGALLAYLKCCAGSVLADHRRSQQARQREDQLESVTQEPLLDDVAESVVDRLAAQELWCIIAREAPTQEERLILLMVCAQGMSPRALQQCYPAIFPTVEVIYHIKRNVLERLRRNKELLQLLGRQSSRKSREVQRAG